MSRSDAEDSVSSVVGTILMLAVTVSVFGGLSIVVLAEVRSTESPPEAELAFVSDGTRAILSHRGGEPIKLDDGFLLLNVAGTEIRYDLTDVADQTADGKFWRIGETLCLSGPATPDPARPCLTDGQTILGVAIVASGGLLADEGERGAEAGPCPLDNVAPVVDSPWSFSIDVFTTSTGPVTVTFTATDDCSGVDDAVAPSLFYRVNDGSDPAFSPITTVTNTAPGTWEGVVPAQSWNLLGGQDLEVYASGVQDERGNVAGDSAIETEFIDIVTLIQYVTAATAIEGTIGPLGPAQADGDGEAATTAVEAGTLGSVTTFGPTKLSGTAYVTGTATAGAALNAINVLGSNDVRAELDTTDDYIEVSGFGTELPDDATITSLSIGYEGRKASSGGTGSTMRLDYKVGSGSYSLGTTFVEDYFSTSAPLDTDRTRSVCATQTSCATGSFTVANVEQLTVRVFDVSDENRNAQVDHVFVTVTYTTPAVTTYSLELELEFDGTDDGSSETLELHYQTSGDTYRISVLTSSGYTQVGTLSSTGSFTTFTYELASSGEYNLGKPMFLIEDGTPTGTTAGSLQIDYARMVTV